MRWGAGNGGDLPWRDWDGEVVVFARHRRSTHLLGGTGAALFLTLIDSPRPLTLSELHDCLNEGGSGAAAPDSLAELEAALLEFERLGLAARHLS
jgi:hypothetical protein